MRQYIDLAILPLAPSHTWVETFLIDVLPALTRVRVHRLTWPSEYVFTSDVQVDIQTQRGDLAYSLTQPPPLSLPHQYLARNTIALRRYDACLVPVDFESLAWTRQALSAIPRGPFIPLIGVLNLLKAASIQDLTELGMADFVRLPICTEEFRARLLSAMNRMPRSTSLRECDGQAPYGGNVVQPTRDARRLTASRLRAMGFKDAKQAMIDKFECDFLTDTLNRHEGNISLAARAARKHRRAFWELMRKHGISAHSYKPESEYI
jgi:hypothetical protein